MMCSVHASRAHGKQWQRSYSSAIHILCVLCVVKVWLLCPLLLLLLQLRLLLQLHLVLLLLMLHARCLLLLLQT